MVSANLLNYPLKVVLLIVLVKLALLMEFVIPLKHPPVVIVLFNVTMITPVPIKKSLLAAMIVQTVYLA